MCHVLAEEHFVAPLVEEPAYYMEVGNVCFATVQDDAFALNLIILVIL